MQKYSEFRPTQFDSKGAFLDDDRQEWLIVNVGRNRDSGPLSESNFASALKILGGEGDDVEVHRFGHWGPGWFEIIIVRPDTDAARIGDEIADALENYPVLDDDDFSERETNEANEVWKNCYRLKDRIEYIRKHRSQFDFHDFADMLGCVRGEYFAGYASELIS